MDRLAEQVVAWHNRSPLAKRISIYDVHTIGVVALPFVGGSASPRPQAAPKAPREPVMDPLPAAEAAEPSPEARDLPAAAEAGAAPAAALEAGPTLPASLAAAGPGSDGAKPLPAWLRWLPAPLRAWLPKPGGAQRLFSERFISQLSPAQIARFALKYGDRESPGEEDWPQRAIAIDERLMNKAAARGLGSWPYEIYLISAGVDAGASRARILMAYDADFRLKVLGRRCLNPLAVAVLAALLLLFVGAPTLWLMGRQQATDAPTAGPAASAAASGVVAVSGSAPSASAASAPMPASVAPGASSPAIAASAPASQVPPPEAPASVGQVIGESTEPQPDIRPQLVPRRPEQGDRPPLRSASPAASAAPVPAPAASQPVKAEAEAPGRAGPDTAAGKTPPARDAKAPATARNPERALNEQAQDKPRVRAPGSESAGSKAAAATGGKQVALVSPATASKAEAEAALERMRSLLGETVGDPASLQGRVFQTHEGWRAAVWPFATREEAQLINATLVARGLRTRAVDF